MLDECTKLYIEETSDLLQTAEEALIRLENRYSEEDINTIFRCAHTIKGSSASMEFQEISDITHKIEDLLDVVRKGEVSLDKNIINLCFLGLDIVGRMTKSLSDASYKVEEIEEEIEEISNSILNIIRKEEPISKKQKKIDLGNYKKIYFVFAIFDSSSLMLAARRFLFLSAVKEAGEILFSDPNEEFMSDIGNIDDTCGYKCLFSTNFEIDYLKELFRIDEINLVKLIDVSESTILDDEYLYNEKDILYFKYFFDTYKKISEFIFRYNEESFIKNIRSNQESLLDFRRSIINDMKLRISPRAVLDLKEDIYTFFDILIGLFENKSILKSNDIAICQRLYMNIWYKVYNLIENKLMFRYIKLYNIKQLENINLAVAEKLEKKFIYVLLDVSMLEIVEYDDINNIINTKRHLEKRGIKFYLINNGIHRKRFYNIFESIAEVELIRIYYSKIEALMEYNWKNMRNYIRLEED